VSFVVPAIHAQFHGTLLPDGKTLKGTWSQGKDLPVTLIRQSPPPEIATPVPSAGSTR